MTEQDNNHHVTSVIIYLLVFAGLLILLVLTIAASFVDLGPFDQAVTLAIAVAKAGLIMAYFMHLRHSSYLTWIFAGMGFFWLILMLVLTIGDYLARGGLVTTPIG